MKSLLTHRAMPAGRRLLAAALMVSTFVVLPACTSTEEELVAALDGQLPAGPPSPLQSDHELVCGVEGLVAEVGTDRLEAVGITPESAAPSLADAALSDDDLEAIGRAVEACAPEDRIDAAVDAVIEEHTTEPTCVGETIGDAFRLRIAGARAVARDPMLSESFFEELFDAEAACG